MPSTEVPARTSGPAVLVNGRSRPLGDPPASTTLLTWLRGLGLTGAKEGCAEGECGACAVMVATDDGQGGTRWEAVTSCLLPAAALAGQEVVTVEGLGAPGHLHPVQHELAARGGSQCGYCTPGFVCALAAEHYRGGPVDPHALSGNLCRCTGYRPIREAAQALTEPDPADPLARRRAEPSPRPLPVRVGADERFVRPRDLAEALDLLAEPGAVAVAGCTDWGVEVNLRHRRAPLVVAVDALPELLGVRAEEGRLEIGAGVRLSRLEDELEGRVPLLAKLLPLFGSRLVRNRATLGGNLATASPVGDAAPVLMALEASLRLVGQEGEREVPVADCFTGYRSTVLRPGELVRSVLVPLPVLPLARFSKVTKRRLDDISGVAVAVAARVGTGPDGPRVERIRIGLGGVAGTPVRGVTAERLVEGAPWTAETVARAAEAQAAALDPLDDLRATADYRRAMVRQALLRFHHEATGAGP